jgi:hypothetical protein
MQKTVRTRFTKANVMEITGVLPTLPKNCHLSNSCFQTSFLKTPTHCDIITHNVTDYMIVHFMKRRG